MPDRPPRTDRFGPSMRASHFLRGLLVVALGACARSSDAGGEPPDWTVGPAAIGRTALGQAPAAFAAGQQITGDLAPTGAACIYWRPRGAPPGVSFMIDSGRVMRVDVDSGRVLTAAGVGVGTTVDALQAAYGARLQVQPHKYNYEEGWQTMTVWEPDSTAALVFEVDRKQVQSYRAGLRPQVLFVERCS